MEASITVAIPAIPPRVGNLLNEAVQSVRDQRLVPSGGISCALDVDHAGAGTTRQRALDGVYTAWVAFLDDDDLLYANHLETLYGLAIDHQVDFAYSWFDGNNPFPSHRGQQQDLSDNLTHMHHTTMTVLVRTALAKEVGFSRIHPEGWTLPQEDWQFITGCAAAGARFIGSPDVTWHYRVHGNNTSGLPLAWR